VLRISPFTDSDVLMAVAQSEAPVRVNTVARIARHPDVKKAIVCLKTPLRGVIRNGQDGNRYKIAAHITNAKNAHIVPMRMR